MSAPAPTTTWGPAWHQGTAGRRPRGSSRRLGSDHDLFAGLESGDDLRRDAVHYADFDFSLRNLSIGGDHAQQRAAVGKLIARIGARGAPGAAGSCAAG
jgi:hypothetical protein